MGESGAEQFSVEVLCCYWQSGHGQATQPPRRPHTSHMSCRDISMAEPSGLSTVWPGQLQKQLQFRSRGEAALGINLHPGKHPNNHHHGNHSNPPLGNVTEWLQAPTMLLSMCGHFGLAKAVATLRLSMITICKLRASFLFTQSHVLSLGLKMHWSKSVKSCDCDQRS